MIIEIQEENSEDNVFENAIHTCKYNYEKYNLLPSHGDFICDDNGNAYRVIGKQFVAGQVIIWLNEDLR